MGLTFITFLACKHSQTAQFECDLYIRYEAATQNLKAEAEIFLLSENGAKSSYHPKSGLAFMGSNMEKKSLDRGRTRYDMNFNGPLPPTLVLSWKDEQANSNMFQLKPLQIQDFEFLPSEETFTLGMQAEALTKNENMVLLFTDADGQMMNLKKTGPSESALLQFSNNSLQKLAKGKGQLGLVRTKVFLEKQPNCTCQVTFSYYTDYKEIDL